MKKGDAICYYPDKFSLIAYGIAFISHPILFFIKGPWNIPTHTAVYLGEGKIAEAIFPDGFVIRPADKYLKRKRKAFSISKIDDMGREAIVSYAKSLEGSPYDVWSYLGFLALPIFRFLRIPNIFNGIFKNKDLFCSEAYAKSAKEAGYPFKLHPSFCTPYDISADSQMREVGLQREG